MIIKTRGIILRSIKYSETSFIVDIYTEAKGLQSYIISGVRNSRSRVSAGLLQLMSLVDLVAYFRDDKDLHRIKEIKAAHIYTSLPFDMAKSAVGLFMIELAQKTIQEQEENTQLFEFLYSSFQFLDETKKPVGNVHLHFMLELSAYLGFRPHGIYSDHSAYFDMQEGIFISQAPDHLHFLSPPMSQMLSQLLHMEIDESCSVKIDRKQRRELLRLLIDFYRLHIENFPKLNAHLILEEVLG